MRRTLLALLAITFITTSTGCCLVDRIINCCHKTWCTPCGHHGGCCDDACCDDCCGDAICHDDCCDTGCHEPACCGGHYGGHCGDCSILGWLHHCLCPGWGGCSGCGDLYKGDCHGYPDPCCGDHWSGHHGGHWHDGPVPHEPGEFIPPGEEIIDDGGNYDEARRDDRGGSPYRRVSHDAPRGRTR